VEYQIGAIPIGDGQGKEIISRFSTDVQSGKTWYTDSNGREYQTRILNYRPSWNYTIVQPVSGNYYPVNVGMYIKDSTKQFSLLTDRSLGGTSLQNGQVEVMIQRRLLYDDGRGVGEPLNETDGITPYDQNGNGGIRIGTGMHVSGLQRILVDSSMDSFSMRKIRSEQSKFFSPLVVKFSKSSTMTKNEGFSKLMLKTELPLNVEIMTLQSLGNGLFLLRLAHQFAVGEDSMFSVPVKVSFKGLFSEFEMIDVKEVSLTTNRDIQVVPVFEWKGEKAANDATFKVISFGVDEVIINPMDIRTFTFKKA